MFLVNGGKFKNEQMTADEVIDFFGIKVKPNGFGFVEFVYCDAFNKKDRHGQKRVLNLLSLTPLVRGVYKGESYSVRWFQSMNEDNGRKTFFPTRIRFSPDEESLQWASAKEKIIARIFLKDCADSPLRGDHDKRAIYKVMDRNVEATGKVTFAREQSRLVMEILDMEESKLRRKAKGIRVKGRHISNVPKKSIGQVQDELINLISVDLVAFADAWKGSSTDVRGLAVDCLDYGVVVAEVRGRDRLLKWEDGTVILKTLKSRNIIDVFAAYIVEHYNDIIPIINEKMSEKELQGLVDSVSSPSATNEGTIGFVKKAAKLGNLILTFEGGEAKAAFIVDGAPKGDLIEVPNAAQWHEAVAEWAESHASRMRKLENASNASSD